MSRQHINIGSVANDGTGDVPRTAFDKANDNFIELYDAVDGIVNHWRGNYNASSNQYPSSGGSGTAGAIQAGDQWHVSVQGDLNVNGIGTVTVYPGALLVAVADTPGQTASNWKVIQ